MEKIIDVFNKTEWKELEQEYANNEVMLNEIRRLKKLQANTYWPAIGSDTFFCHNIDVAEKITKDGHELLSKMMKTFKETFWKHLIYDILKIIDFSDDISDNEFEKHIFQELCNTIIQWNNTKIDIDSAIDKIKEEFKTDDIKTFMYGESTICNDDGYPYLLSINGSGASIKTEYGNNDNISYSLPADTINEIRQIIFEALLCLKQNNKELSKYTFYDTKVDYIYKFIIDYENKWDQIKKSINDNVGEIKNITLTHDLEIIDDGSIVDTEKYKFFEDTDIDGIYVTMYRSNPTEDTKDEKFPIYNILIEKSTLKI